MGSFIVSLGQDKVLGRSKCNICGKVLTSMELIPIFSYLRLKGKCSRCSSKINVLYLVFEIIGAFSFPMLYHYTNDMISSLLYGSILLFLLRISITDLREGYIYIFDILCLLSLRVVLGLVQIKDPIPFILSGLSIGALLLLIQIISKGLGTGDIIYGMLLSSFFPLSMITYYFISSTFILGGFVAGIKVYILKRNRKEEMAFAPYLSMGFIITIIWRGLC